MLVFTFVAAWAGPIEMADAQVCTIDSQYAFPGVFPSDTLPEMALGVGYQTVVQVVLPIDTVAFGFVLPFDSFWISHVTGLPAGLQWECNQNHPQCRYRTTPGINARACLKLSGMPIATNPAFPAYDSIVVSVVAFMTVPFLGSQSIDLDFALFDRVANWSGNDASYATSGSLEVAPNPASGYSKAHSILVQDANVKLSLLDLLGREVVVVYQGRQATGEQEILFDTQYLAPGSYLLQLSIEGVPNVETRKFIVVH